MTRRLLVALYTSAMAFTVAAATIVPLTYHDM